MAIHVECQNWDEAFLLLKTHAELKDDVYLPYARWRCDQDRFDEARVAFKEAGHPERSELLLQQLNHNAVL
mgnify:CR=1 FL=1